MEIDTERYRKTFFEEASEHLASLEAAVLRLERGPHDPALIDDAFRAAHSIKGGADAVGFPHVAHFTHALEGLLDGFRGLNPMARPVLDLLLEASDTLAHLLAAAKRNCPAPPGVDMLLQRLTAATIRPRSTGAWWNAPNELAGKLGIDPSAVEASTAASRPSRLLPYTVNISPHADVFRSGLDPLVLLRELKELGTIEHVRLNKEKLPCLLDLDPERCYITWTIDFKTDKSPAAITEVFAFAPEMMPVVVEPKGRPAEVTPRPSLPNLSELESAISRQLVPEPLRLATFLVERGAISAERALDALNKHRARRPTFGCMAVETGLMSVDKLFETLDRAADVKRFGQTAVELGYLREADLGRLFLLQEQQTPPFHECLVADGILDQARLDEELKAFRANANTSVGGDSEFAEAIPEIPAKVPAPPGASVFDEYGSMIADFCTEAADHLEAADRYLLVLDGDPANFEALNAIYRGFHTIKGVSSMLRLQTIQTLAHEAENLLNLARDGKLVLRGKALDIAFASTDALKRQIKSIHNWTPDHGPIEADPILPQLLADLQAMVGGEREAEPLRGKEAPGEAAKVAVRVTEQPPASAPPPSPREISEGQPVHRPIATDKETVRVDKDRLDKLTNTIGELVIAQSMAQQEFDELTVGSGWHSRALSELKKISHDLQELGLSLRMVPLQGVFQKMTRLVRDLSRKMDKPVELELHGEETELDKTVVDQLGDPLMHMVRNAIDHGLELPADRIAVGKPREGRVILKAYHQGGNVYIELTDDGRGLDRDRILRKAMEKGLVAEGHRLSDTEIYALIFAPGFSTAQVVTDVSGRGVGMDVVRRNVEALQGNILIRTQLGKGTTFTIRLPLTLAIMDGLMVGLGEDVYIVPLLSVIESFRPLAKEVHTLAGQREVVVVRGEVVPLLRLYRLLGRPGRISDPCAGLVVLVEDQGKKHAILVDELLGQMQAVVKSLDTNFRRIEGLAGATILGDGRVAMILDVHGLTQLYQIGGGGSTCASAPPTSSNIHGDNE